MCSPSDNDLTRTLADVASGRPGASDELTAGVYKELRALAQRIFEGQRSGHTLQPTILVHEAWMRLAGGGARDWNDRKHFFSAAAKAMRQVLTDHHRRHAADKRMGRRHKVTLDAALGPAGARDVDLGALDDALTVLSELSERQCRIVELRFFAGLKIEEIARVLEISRTTVNDEWRGARAWLRRELSEGRE